MNTQRLTSNAQLSMGERTAKEYRRDARATSNEGEGIRKNMCFCETNRIGFGAFCDGTIYGKGSYDRGCEKMNPVRLAKPNPFWGLGRSRGTTRSDASPRWGQRPSRGGDRRRTGADNLTPQATTEIC